MFEVIAAFAAGAASCFVALYLSAILRRRDRPAHGENSKTDVGETVVAVLNGRPIVGRTLFQRLIRRSDHAHP